MEDKFKVRVCLTNQFPIWRGFFQNIFAGSISFSSGGVSVRQNRFLFRKPLVVYIPYSYLSSYLRKRNEIYFNHKSKDIPKLVMINVSFLRIKRLAEIEKILQKNEIPASS